MDDTSFVSQWHLNSVDPFRVPPLASAFEDTLRHSLEIPSSDLEASLVYSQAGYGDGQTEEFESASFVSCKVEQASPPVVSSSSVVSFKDPSYSGHMGIVNLKEEIHSRITNNHPSDVLTQGSLGRQDYAFKAYHGGKKVATGTRLSQAQDHIIAERKRREKLSQRFIALSAIIPGLKKTDKASVLGDAIKYLRHLQERVKILEEQTRSKTMESVILVKKSQLIADGENSSSDRNFFSGPSEPLPDIEARICDKNVLIRIHCEKRKGALEKTIAEIEKLQLAVVNSSAMTFGSSALAITIIAKMDADLCVSVTNLVKKLQSSLSC